MNESIPSRRILYPEDRGEPIAQTLKNLREETFAVPPSPEDPDDIDIPEYEKIKTEVYALTAFVIERVYQEAEVKLQHDSLQILSNRRFPLTVEDVEEIDVKELSEARPEKFFRMLTELSEVYPTAFALALDEWRTLTLENNKTYDARVRSRFMDLLMETDMGIRARVKDDSYLPEAFVVRGANTAASTSWDIMRAIPVTYFNTFGRVITPGEYKVLAQNSESLVIMLSSLHIQSLTHLIDFARAGSRIHKSLDLEFPLELFKIIETEDGLALSFDDSALEAFARFKGDRYAYETSEEKRIGCPARDARVKDGEGNKESVVTAIHRFHYTLAEKYIIPRMDDYVEGALQIATK